MAELHWDYDGERLYETGTSKGVFYPKGPVVIGDEDVYYSGGVAWNGLISVTEKPTGADAEALWADDIKYLELRGREEFEATVEAYTYPPEMALADGMASPVPGVSIGQQPRKYFGMCYRSVIGNDVKAEEYGYKLHLIYGCMVSPSERGYQTINDSPEAITFSWDMTTTPVAVEDYKATSCLVIDSTKYTSTDARGRLDDLEEILYGTSTTEPRLPLPDEVFDILAEPPVPPGP